MSELKICRICLRTEAKVYNYEQFQLKSYYEEVLALKVSDTDELPHYFCFECATLLHKFHKFKEKCYSGQKVLKEMLRKGPAGIIELSKFSSKTTCQDPEVENPFLETDTNLTELSLINPEFNSTDPVEIDSFFINNLDVVLEDESVTENASLSKICDETTSEFHSFEVTTVEPDTDLSGNTNINLNVENLTENDQLPTVICDLPIVNETLLESDLGYEEIDSNLTENLEGLDDNESSMLYGDLPSISQAFDESNIECIQNSLDLTTNNNIDANLISISDLPSTSQELVIEYMETGLTNNNNAGINVKETVKESTNSYYDSLHETQKKSENISSTSSEEHNIQSCNTNTSEAQSESYCTNKNLDNKVRITSKNQVAPNIHSVPGTSKEYFEAVPEPIISSECPEDSLNQLQVEQARIEGPIKKKRITKHPGKQVKPSPCNKKCVNKCSVKLTEVDRLVIHERYWKMDKTAQQDWLLSCIRPKKIRRRQGTTLLKNVTYDYYITQNGKDIKVCQQFLMKTLDISQMRFRYAISKHVSNEESDSDLSLCSQES